MQMVENWVLSKLTTLVGDKDIYSVYCPVCKNKGVNENGGLYDCPVCSAQYVMDSNNGKDDQSLVWLCNIRR